MILEKLDITLYLNKINMKLKWSLKFSMKTVNRNVTVLEIYEAD